MNLAALKIERAALVHELEQVERERRRLQAAIATLDHRIHRAAAERQFRKR
jgi:hypothetical protein